MLSSTNRKLDVTFVESALGASAPSAPTVLSNMPVPNNMEPSDFNVNINNNITEEFSHEEEIANTGWTTLTPQEIAIWIDRRARLVFPISFLVFNMFFWTFVYCI